jgi:hypothetical protein
VWAGWLDGGHGYVCERTDLHDGSAWRGKATSARFPPSVTPKHPHQAPGNASTTSVAPPRHAQPSPPRRSCPRRRSCRTGKEAFTPSWRRPRRGCAGSGRGDRGCDASRRYARARCGSGRRTRCSSSSSSTAWGACRLRAGGGRGEQRECELYSQIVVGGAKGDSEKSSCFLRDSLSKTEAALRSFMAPESTMFLTMKRPTALSCRYGRRAGGTAQG